MKELSRLIRKPEFFFHWAKERLNHNQQLILSAVLIGATAGMAAIALKTATHAVRHLFTTLPPQSWESLLLLAGPGIGILLCTLYLRYILKKELPTGTADVLYAVKKKFGLMAPFKTYAHIISSSLTAGLGGSVGLEAPIVVTGAALGSNFGRVYRFSEDDRLILIACGCAAGIAAIFNAPIAGLIFAIEVLLSRVSLGAFIPIMIASVAGSLCSQIVLHEDILLSYKQPLVFHYQNVPYYLVMSIFIAFVSLYYYRISMFVRARFARIGQWQYRILFSGLLIALLVLFFPSLFGEGYESITQLLNGDPEAIFRQSALSALHGRFYSWMLLLLIGTAMLLKAWATSLTLAGGGNGGNFAPSLFVGAYCGFFFASGINLLDIGIQLPVSNFVIVGMAAAMSGIMHAPLTAIFLIAEITGGYELMIPIMMVSAISFAINRRFYSVSLDKQKLIGKLPKSVIAH